MVNKALRIVLYSIFTISLLFVMPVNIYADTISASNIVGVNVELLGSTILEHREDSGNNYYYKQYSYKAIIELDNSYVGVIGARVQGNYYEKLPVQNSQLLTQSFNYYRKIYVNGNSAEMTFVVSTWYSSVQDPINYRADGTSPSVTIEDSNVTKFEDIDSIEQIIDILSDIYQNSADIEGLNNDMLAELQSIVYNTNLSNQYLDMISKFRQYNIMFESMPYVYTMISKHYNKINDLYNLYSWQYPIFDLLANDEVIRMYASSTNRYYDLVFLTNVNITAANGFLSFFDTNISCKADTEVLGLSDSGTYLKIVKVKIYDQESTGTFSATCKNNMKFIPIYCNRDNAKMGLTTDFSLLFGYSNQLLDDLHLIADGTNASSAASSQSDQANQQLQTDSNTLFSQEDSFKQNMQQSMNNIDTTFSLNNFGSSFMTSAQWIRTQYETLTNNTPFASLITFSLLVGLALIVIGKVYK